MNSVQEPGSNGDSKTSPSQKPGRKTNPGVRAPSWPSRHAQVRTGVPRRAHAWPYRGQAWPCHGRGPLPYRSPRSRVAALRVRPYAPCRERLSTRPYAPFHAPLRALPSACRRPPWPYRERTSCRIVGASRPCSKLSYRVAALRARVSRPSSRAPCARLRAQPAQMPSHNTIFCIAAKPSPSVTIQILYRNTALPANSLPQSQLYCNTIANPPSLLQYNLSSSLHFQQAFLLQYTSKSCNTISPSQYKMGSSKFPNFYTIFFSFLIINIFVFIISSSKKSLKSFFFATGKIIINIYIYIYIYTYIYTYFFFHFP